ncbi:glycosyltransferase-like protein gnt13 isoform X2 [Daktulosphaira vitifoliae]|uniref:glycosyltransferase-like protein gnt13 isoform X2 n=1 Tax=Daktulosphaira vitifoliae TaxID=58002 RepID=UPI0021A9A833|nr:glycosyltransferase-like protein gnt13 isoform X2 [Daktulosphaira vitifoliae]
MSFYVFFCVILCLTCVQIASSVVFSSYYKDNALEREKYPIANYIVDIARSKFRNFTGALTFGAMKHVIETEHMDSHLFNYVQIENFYENDDELSVNGLFNDQYMLLKKDEDILKENLSRKITNNNDNKNDNNNDNNNNINNNDNNNNDINNDNNNDNINNDNNNDGIVKLQYAKDEFSKSNLFRGKLTEEALDKIIKKCKVENDNISYKEMIKTITDGCVEEELYSIWILKSTDNTLTTPTQ